MLRVEATFFALFWRSSTAGPRARRWWAVTSTTGWLGYTALVLISAACTAAAWILVPLSKSTASAQAFAAEAPSGIQVRSGAARLITRAYR